MSTILERSITQQLELPGTKVFRQMFDNTCQMIEQLDGKGKFIEQSWTRNNGTWVGGESSGDSIYIDRALDNGNVFE
ncbi:MAG: coproporphyrinogen III oxidase, partial [Nostoc sp. C3-bin3]|nr:coproporphyrinogen III oxidase [Nostoc sp. C3-bin3]